MLHLRTVRQIHHLLLLVDLSVLLLHSRTATERLTVAVKRVKSGVSCMSLAVNWLDMSDLHRMTRYVRGASLSAATPDTAVYWTVG